MQYAEALVSTVITGLSYTDKKPSIYLIHKNMKSHMSVVNLTIKVMECCFARHYGPDVWMEKVKYASNDTLQVRFKRLTEWFNAHFLNYEGAEPIEWIDTVGRLVDYSMSDPEHMSKMTAGIMPLFSRLTEQPLNELLSPSPNTLTSREIVTSDGMFSTGGVLYISLDGLSNPESARAISQLIMSDLTSCAGSRYNADDGDMSSHSRISIFVDEAHSAINNS
ncbi:conjugative transfer system coupling protein TraD, partial [Escherichia coli]